MWRRVPQFPGPLNQLVRKNMREILATLDFYCALILSLAVLAYRVFGPALPPEAFMAMTVLVVGAMSSYAQCLFGLDGEGGLSRYRLLPVRGWQLLLAKDVAFLAVVIPLTLPLGRAAGHRRGAGGAGGGARAGGGASAAADALAVLYRRRARQRGDSVDRAGDDSFGHLFDERVVSGRGGRGVGGFALVVRTRCGTRAGLHSGGWRPTARWRWSIRPADSPPGP